jgi:hypothetical protein
MRKIIDILLRIIASPCVLVLHIIFATFWILKGTALFLWYGGEFISYRIDDRKTINDLYQQLKELNDEDKDNAVK